MNLVIEIKLLVDTTRTFRCWLQLALYTCGNILRQHKEIGFQSQTPFFYSWL